MVLVSPEMEVEVEAEAEAERDPAIAGIASRPVIDRNRRNIDHHRCRNVHYHRYGLFLRDVPFRNNVIRGGTATEPERKNCDGKNGKNCEQFGVHMDSFE